MASRRLGGFGRGKAAAPPAAAPPPVVIPGVSNGHAVQNGQDIAQQPQFNVGAGRGSISHGFQDAAPGFAANNANGPQQSATGNGGFDWVDSGMKSFNCDGEQKGGFGGASKQQRSPKGGFGSGFDGGATVKGGFVCSADDEHPIRGGGNFGRGGFGGGAGRVGNASSGGCNNCGEQGHMFRDCPQKGGHRAGGGGGDRRTCNNCGMPGHMAMDCPDKSSKRSGGRRDDAFASNNNDDGGGGFGAEVTVSGTGGGFGDRGGRGVCYNCGSTDHMKRDCPRMIPRYARPREGQASSHRQSTDHFAANFPERGDKPLLSDYVPDELSDEQIFDLENHLRTGLNFSKYHIGDAVLQNGDGIEPINAFEEAGLDSLVLKNLKRMEYSTPTIIQRYAMPVILRGRDLMACAQTGSGKTAAFLAPILTYILQKEDLTVTRGPQYIYALCITPTRELSTQIFNECRRFAAGSLLRIANVYGGVRTTYHVDMVQSGCHILTGTLGRIKDFILRERVKLDRCKFFILDEADRMLEEGFGPDIRQIEKMMPERGARQTLMFSATFPDEIQKLAQQLMLNHCSVFVGVVGGANQDVLQTIYEAPRCDKRDKLKQLLLKDLENAMKGDFYTTKTLVFVNQKRFADFLASFLSQSDSSGPGIQTTSIHGDRGQNLREEALKDFTSGRCPVCIATDVAARGLDIKGVDHVINFDMPSDIETYVHRIGRTGRIGNPGRATSFFDYSADARLVKELVKILADAMQEVPDWLLGYAKGYGEFDGGFGGASSFGGVPFRASNNGFNNTNDTWNSTPAVAAPVVVQDESWD